MQIAHRIFMEILHSLPVAMTSGCGATGKCDPTDSSSWKKGISEIIGEGESCEQGGYRAVSLPFDGCVLKRADCDYRSRSDRQFRCFRYRWIEQRVRGRLV